MISLTSSVSEKIEDDNQEDRWMGLIMIPGDRWTRVFLLSDNAYVTS